MSFENLLKENFAFNINKIEQAESGWTADGYKVNTDNGEYFLKVYDKDRYSILPWLERIDKYIPVLLRLEKDPFLGKHIPMLCKTVDGHHKTEDKKYVLLLFAFINGKTIGHKQLTLKQAKELASIIGHLHKYSRQTFMPIPAIKEDTSLSFCLKLQKLLTCNDLDKPMLSIFQQYDKQLVKALALIFYLHKQKRSGYRNLVLCHTDAHNWNIMQANSLLLLDWEGLCFAPAEADLFMFYSQYYFKDFMREYQKIHLDYHLNQDLLYYYLLRRKFQDIWEFISQILFDNLDEKTKEDVYKLLQKECSQLKPLLKSFN